MTEETLKYIRLSHRQKVLSILATVFVAVCIIFLLVRRGIGVQVALQLGVVVIVFAAICAKKNKIGKITLLLSILAYLLCVLIMFSNTIAVLSKALDVLIVLSVVDLFFVIGCFWWAYFTSTGYAHDKRLRKKAREIKEKSEFLGEKQYADSCKSALKSLNEEELDALLNEVSEKYERQLAEARAASKARLAASNLSLEYEGKSVFDGRLIQKIGWRLLAGLLTLVTIGIAYPAAMCMKLRWTTKHKIYDGCRLTFDGKGIQLLGKWILWLLLSLVTLGIYAWFIPIKLEKWKVSHIHFA